MLPLLRKESAARHPVGSSNDNRRLFQTAALENAFSRCNISTAIDKAFPSLQHKHAVPYPQRCFQLPLACLSTYSQLWWKTHSTHLTKLRYPHLSPNVACHMFPAAKQLHAATLPMQQHPHECVCCGWQDYLLPESELAKHRRGPGHPQQHWQWPKTRKVTFEVMQA